MLSNFNQATRFDEFMHFALYNPQYGYYSRGEGIFGGEGDFVTAPELSPLFGQTLGKAIREVLPRCGGVVYEFGAGTGKLACDVLATAGDLITQYNIVDVSGGLKLVQLTNLMAQHGPEIEKKVRGLSTLPDKLDGVILGNEVLDATPVRRFKWSNTGPLEAWVQQVDGALQLVWQAADPQFATTVTQLQTQHGPWPEGYESEVAEQSIAWVKTVTDRLNGIALMIDYGFRQQEYYHPQRNTGTLMAHFHHQALSNVLALPGISDITCHINFSNLLHSIENEENSQSFFSSQASYLLDAGITDLVLQQSDPRDAQQMSADITD